jgi:shikimate kinase
VGRLTSGYSTVGTFVNMVLVGLMGSGKTSVARLLAHALGRQLRDSDDDRERAYGATAAEQVEQHGKEVLHEREQHHLKQALAAPGAPVIAAAASVVDDPGCRTALADAFVVWRDAPPPVLADRMRDGEHRPHYDPDLERMLSDQRDRRAGYFRAVADLVVDVSEIGPEAVVDRVQQALVARWKGG